MFIQKNKIEEKNKSNHIKNTRFTWKPKNKEKTTAVRTTREIIHNVANLYNYTLKILSLNPKTNYNQCVHLCSTL